MSRADILVVLGMLITCCSDYTTIQPFDHIGAENSQVFDRCASQIYLYHAN